MYLYVYVHTQMCVQVCVYRPIESSVWLIVYMFRGDHLGLGSLLGAHPMEEWFFLSSHKLPVALHLMVGPCKSSPIDTDISAGAIIG